MIEFVKGYSDNTTKEKVDEPAKSAEERDLEKRREAFEKLDRMLRENSHYFADIGDNDKEILLKHLDEKYGEGL